MNLVSLNEASKEKISSETVNEIVINKKQLILTQPDKDILIKIIENLENTCDFSKERRYKVENNLSFLSKNKEDTDTLVPFSSDVFTKFIPEISELNFPSIFLKHNSPYNDVKRLICYVEDGFLISTIDLLPIALNDSFFDMYRYDMMKYNELVSPPEADDKTSADVHEPQLDYMIAWLELSCVNPSKRGKGLFDKLLKHLIEHLIAHCNKNYPNYSMVILGIDISGTKNNKKNLSLKEYYIKKGFIFEPSEFHFMTQGSQVGYMIINI